MAFLTTDTSNDTNTVITPTSRSLPLLPNLPVLLLATICITLKKHNHYRSHYHHHDDIEFRALLQYSNYNQDPKDYCC